MSTPTWAFLHGLAHGARALVSTFGRSLGSCPCASSIPEASGNHGSDRTLKERDAASPAPRCPPRPNTSVPALARPASAAAPRGSCWLSAPIRSRRPRVPISHQPALPRHRWPEAASNRHPSPNQQTNTTFYEKITNFSDVTHLWCSWLLGGKSRGPGPAWWARESHTALRLKDTQPAQ